MNKATLSRLFGPVAAFICSAVFTPTGAYAQELSLSPDDVRMVPSFGIPYYSKTLLGRNFYGSVTIDEFMADGGQLKAFGSVITGQRIRPSEFPVQVLEATCEVLELEIGPPVHMPRLQTPLLVVQTASSSQLGRSGFCNISEANALGDTALVAALLNEKGPEGPLASNSCDWWTAIECAFVISYCRTVCSIGGTLNPLCVECVTKNGPEKCLKCF